MLARKITLSLIALCWAFEVQAMASFRAGKDTTTISGKVPTDTQIELIVKYQMQDPDSEFCYRLPSQFSITLTAKNSSEGSYKLELPLRAFNEDCGYSYHSAQYHIMGPSIDEYILMESSESLQEQVKLLNADYSIPEVSTLKNIICEFNSEELGLCEVDGALPDTYLITSQLKNIEIHILSSSEQIGPE